MHQTKVLSLRTNPTQWCSSKSDTEINQISLIFLISLSLAIGCSKMLKTWGKILHCKLGVLVNHGKLSFLHHYWNRQKNAIYTGIIFQNICSAVMIKPKDVLHINQQIQLIQYVMLRIKITHQSPKLKLICNTWSCRENFTKVQLYDKFYHIQLISKWSNSNFNTLNHKYILRRRLRRSSR